MSNNVTFINELHDSCNGGVIADIKHHTPYHISFDVVGECKLKLKIKDITGRIIRAINKTNQYFIDGSYEFGFISMEDGILTYDIEENECCFIKNIKIMEGGI